MVNNHENRQFSAFRNPQNKPLFQNGQKSQKSAILGFPAPLLLRSLPLPLLSTPVPPSIERKHRKLHSGNIGNSILETSARKLHSGNIGSETPFWKLGNFRSETSARKLPLGNIPSETSARKLPLGNIGSETSSSPVNNFYLSWA